MGRGSSWDEVVRLAGLRNAVGDLPVDGWGQVPLSKEKLIELDPDLLVLPGWVYGPEEGSEAFYAEVAGDPALRGLKALRRHRLLRMPENLRATTSQHIVEAIEFLAKAAYPEQWEKP
jgi:iron complex transport system substrate-binding protein